MFLVFYILIGTKWQPIKEFSCIPNAQSHSITLLYYYLGKNLDQFTCGSYHDKIGLENRYKYQQEGLSLVLTFNSQESQSRSTFLYFLQIYELFPILYHIK